MFKALSQKQVFKNRKMRNPGVDWSAVDTSWGTSGIKERVFGTGAGDSPAGYFVQSMDGSVWVTLSVN